MLVAVLAACVPTGERRGTLAVRDAGVAAEAGGDVSTGEDAPAGEDADAGGEDAEPAPDAPESPDRPDRPDVGPAEPGPFGLIRESNHGIPGMYLGGVAVADFNKDNLTDVVMAGYWDRGHEGTNCTGQLEARVFINTSTRGGTLSFREGFRTPNLGVCAAQVATGDFNGDGNADFIYQIKVGDDTAVYFGDGAGGFTYQVVERNFGCHSTSLGMAVADFDRDGVDDVAFVSDGDAAYYQAGFGIYYRWNGTSFVPVQPDFQHIMTYGGTIAAGDLTGDGYPEIAVSGNASVAFGEYYCENLLYGQIHRNNAGVLEKPHMAIVANYALKNFGRDNDAAAPNPDRFNATCAGGDNVQYLIADVDNDGNNDLITAGSSGFMGRPGIPGNTHYALAILRNVDGTGTNFVTWENVSMGYDGRPGHLDGNTTNSGVGNVDLQHIAVGDLNGDAWPEIVIQGHRRNRELNDGTYKYQDLLIRNLGNGDFLWEPDALDIPVAIGACGNAIADFNGDGKGDLLMCGAEVPFHSNGSNPDDPNDQTTIRTYLFRQP